MSNEIILKGCTPTPLAAYLKALGILRLVSEQADPEAAGRWDGEYFVLRTKLTKQELEQFFLEQYQPTPLVAPWGARSGFFKGSSEKTAREALENIKSSAMNRLLPYKNTIRLVATLLKEYRVTEKATDEDKKELLKICRARFPDDLLKWLDACYVLTGDDRKYPPLLGTGGNEGSGSYVSGFAQQVVICVINREYDHGISAALFGELALNVASKQTPGHFAPQSSGGPNAGSGFEGELQMNPWDYLLCLEGTLLFASGATRKLGCNYVAFNFPFTVAPTGSGAASYTLADENPKGAKRQAAELWLPLWKRSMGLCELCSLLSEGRVSFGRRAARDGLDFVRAIAGLGVDRGIQAFERYGFLKRFGQSFFAVSLGRKPTKTSRTPENDLLNEVNSWLDRIRYFTRGGKASGRIKQLVHQLEDGIFALAEDGGCEALQKILILFGDIEQTYGIKAIGDIKKKTPEEWKKPQPIPALSEAWVIKADDGSPEYRIACALAGIHADGLPMRAHLAPVKKENNHWSWDAESRRTVWRGGDLVSNLTRIMERRMIESERSALKDKPLNGYFQVDLNAVLIFMENKLDDKRIADLLGGLACARLPQELPKRTSRDSVQDTAPLVFSLLKPLFVPNEVLHELKILPAKTFLPLPMTVIRKLAAGQTQNAIEEAARRLRIAGFAVPPSRQIGTIASGISGPRLLAALMIPLEKGAIAGICWPFISKEKAFI